MNAGTFVHTPQQASGNEWPEMRRKSKFETVGRKRPYIRQGRSASRAHEARIPSRFAHQLTSQAELSCPVPRRGHSLDDLVSTYSFKQHIVVFRLRGPISERVHDYDFRGARPWPARASRRHAPPYASPVATAYGLMLERATEAAAASL